MKQYLKLSAIAYLPTVLLFLFSGFSYLSFAGLLICSLNYEVMLLWCYVELNRKAKNNNEGCLPFYCAYFFTLALHILAIPISFYLGSEGEVYDVASLIYLTVIILFFWPLIYFSGLLIAKLKKVSDTFN